jgi:hypothetical protein
MTFFALAVSIVFVFQMGMISADRLQIQSAADAAAYSGAQVQANSLNSIGQINDGMSYVHYIMLRYAMDAVVYETLHYYESNEMSPTPASGTYGYVLMGGGNSPYEGRSRVSHMWGNNQNLYNLGVRWLADLDGAARLIAEKTPDLVRKTAAQIAGLNGASHIGFSRDIDLAFEIGNQDGQGLTDEAYKDQNVDDQTAAFSKPLYDRYQKQSLPHITKAAPNLTSTSETRALLNPNTWFDHRTGQVSGDREYYQIRICWNDQDWKHDGSGTQHQEGPIYNQFARSRTPNAHWHTIHQHTIQTPSGPVQIPHGQDGNTGGHGPPEDDDTTGLHAQAVDFVRPHHDARKCVTCYDNGRTPRPKGGQSIYAEIKASNQDATRAQNAVTQINQIFGSRLPKGTLALREDALRGGLTVVTWRPSHGIGDRFPASDWGMVAVATAQIGLQTAQGVLPLRSISASTTNPSASYGDGNAGSNVAIPFFRDGANDAANRNLFYDPRPQGQQPNALGGVSFGARLVPIARDLSHNSQTGPGTNLRELLTDGARWYTTGANPSPSGGLPSSGTQNLSNLGRYVSVGANGNGAEAFWH